MKDLVWDNALSVDVEEIDDDHRKLVDLFNLLNHAAAEGESSEYIEAILEELLTCTAWHFSHEERLMVKYGYDGLDEHRKEHQSLIESARRMQKKFLEGGRQVSADEVEFLEHWLTGHILGPDMELGSYLAEAM